MTAFDRIVDAVTDAGYTIRHDTADDVHRIYQPDPIYRDGADKLVGMVIVREGAVRYAELLGKIYPWWTTHAVEAERVGSATYETTDQLIRWIWGNPA